MYETPELECYGTFRELTKGGGNLITDPLGPTNSGIGCAPAPGGVFCSSA